MPPSSSETEADVIAALEEPEAPAVDEWRDAADVGTEAAREAWAIAARDVLLGTARRYHGTVTSKELSGQVQARTRIRTRQLTHYWIGDVLARVSADCSGRGEPLLSSLCVNADGSVGEGYAVVAEAAYGESPGDGDDHAALERLACHRHFDAPDLPASGGVAALHTKLAGSRGRARKARLLERPVPICPVCTMQIPATGICDNCG